MKYNDQEKNFQLIKDYVENKKGFMKYNKMHVEEIKKNYAKMSADIDEDSLNPSNIAHGGLIFGLADSVMGMAARTNGKNVVTINSQIDYLRPGTGKKLTAIATPLKVGKTTAVFKSEIYTDENKLCATVTGTYYFLDREITKDKK